MSGDTLCRVETKRQQCEQADLQNRSGNSPLPITRCGTVVIAPSGCLSPGFCSVPQDRAPQTWRMRINLMHGRSYRTKTPGSLGMLIKQHHTTTFTSEAPRGCQCRHYGYWQAWQALTPNKVVRYSFSISSQRQASFLQGCCRSIAYARGV